MPLCRRWRRDGYASGLLIDRTRDRRGHSISIELVKMYAASHLQTPFKPLGSPKSWRDRQRPAVQRVQVRMEATATLLIREPSPICNMRCLAAVSSQVNT